MHNCAHSLPLDVFDMRPKTQFQEALVTHGIDLFGQVFIGFLIIMYSFIIAQSAAASFHPKEHEQESR